MQEADHRYMVTRVVDGAVQPPLDVSSPFTTGEDCDCCPGQIVAEGDHVVALFRDATLNERVIWGAKSSDGGVSFDQGAELDPTEWTLHACPASGPDGHIDGDTLRYAWMSAAVMGGKVYVGAAALSDLATAPVVQVHPGQPQTLQQNHPRIAAAGDTVAVVWQQLVLGQTEVLFAVKVPGMVQFSDPDTVNVELLGPQVSPDIAFANGTFHVVYADPYEDAIIYRSATLSGAIGIVDPAVPELRVWPVPAVAKLYLRWDGTLAGHRLEIHDPQGRLVLQQQASATIDVDALHAGYYHLVIRTADGSPVARKRFMVTR